MSNIDRSILLNYINEIKEKYRTGITGEETFYGIFAEFIQKMIQYKIHDIEVIPAPTGIPWGKPDFLIFNKINYTILGFAEAKDLGADLNSVKRSEQISRYKDNFENILLTNYIDFIFYVDKRWTSFSLGSIEDLFDHQIPNISNSFDFENFYNFLVNNFLNEPISAIDDVKKLTLFLGKRTKMLKNEFYELMNYEKEEKKDLGLKEFAEGLADYLLIKDKNFQEKCKRFSNLFSQCITLGILFVWIESHKKQNVFENLTLDNLRRLFPQGSGLFYVIFEKFLSNREIENSLKPFLNEMINALNNADFNLIYNKLIEKSEQATPLMHFYEDFLEIVDKDLKDKSGAYYTPIPIAKFICKGINELLKHKFGLEGLHDDKVYILDPASGTATFPCSIINVIEEDLIEHGEQLRFQMTITDKVLKKLFAFELLIAPFVLGLLNYTTLLDSKGINLETIKTALEQDPYDGQIPFCLTNTLELDIKSEFHSFFPAINHNSLMTKKIKEEFPILVFIGNPPWEGIVVSETSKDLTEKLDLYEKKVKQDKTYRQFKESYVKFIRFAHWKIKENPKGGIIGFITNRSYIDGYPMRGMRDALIRDFDEIYILDLHGRTSPKEVLPSATTENQSVFEKNQVGSAIIFAVRLPNNENERNHKIFFNEKWGNRSEKLNYLKNITFGNKINNTQEENSWENIWEIVWDNKEIPEIELNQFISNKNKEIIKRIHENYSKGISIRNIFVEANMGVTIGKGNKKIITKIGNFSLNDLKNLAKKLGYERHLTPIESFNINLKDRVQPYQYSIFDKRNIFYYSKGFHRDAKMLKFLSNCEYKVDQNNLLLILPSNVREFKGEYWNFCYVTNVLPDKDVLSSCDTSHVYPLIFFEKKSNDMISNVVPPILTILSQNYNDKTIQGIDIFNYIVGLLNTPKFLKMYHLKLIYDRSNILFPKNVSQFKEISKLGSKLVNAYLLKLEKIKIFGLESNTVSHTVDMKYISGKGVNKGTFIIPLAIWEYTMGNRFPIQEYIKEREDITWDLENIEKLEKIIGNIQKILDFRNELDDIFEEFDPINLDNYIDYLIKYYLKNAPVNKGDFPRIASYLKNHIKVVDLNILKSKVPEDISKFI